LFIFRREVKSVPGGWADMFLRPQPASVRGPRTRKKKFEDDEFISGNAYSTKGDLIDEDSILLWVKSYPYSEENGKLFQPG